MLRLFLPTGILVAIGLLAISSAAPTLLSLQATWILLGVGFVLAAYFFDWRLILNYRWFIGGIFALSLVLLLTAYFFGSAVRGVRGWIILGPLNFQPVELTKVALILVYASYFSRRHLGIARWRHILTSFLFFAAPTALVLLQPDMGSALVLFGIWFGFLLLAGLPRRRLVLALVALVGVGVLGWNYFLADYQKTRIAGVFYPEQNILGVNYSAAQSRIAIGSAGFWGKGYGQGTQVQLGFLTEPASDFVFAAFTEEWGIFGAILFLGAFSALILGILRTGAASEHNFERFVCLGAAAVFAIQFMLNAGSALGLSPVIGVTFPFVSYGGSSMAANFLLLSIVNAVGRKR